jgi:hypothetical protein
MIGKPGRMPPNCLVRKGKLRILPGEKPAHIRDGIRPPRRGKISNCHGESRIM